jgi:hypothetical protein
VSSPSAPRPRSPRLSSSQRDAFLEQAAHCEGRSPLYAELCRRFVDDPRVGAIGGTPLQLLAGLHYLVLGGEASWDEVDLDAHAEFLERFVREHGVQTNEVQRSWVLLPLFLHAVGGQDVHVVELGASAGLNLVFDRYRYRYEAGEWGPADAPLELTGEERRPLPAELLARGLRVRSRVGIDLDPVDVSTDEGARLLRSFVWAGQEERLARLDQAIRALRTDPPPLFRGDVVNALPDVLDRLDGCVLVFQTGLGHALSQEAWASVRRTLDSYDTVFVSAGRPRDDPRTWGMRIYRGEREFVGHADYHGTWLDYDL